MPSAFVFSFSCGVRILSAYKECYRSLDCRFPEYFRSHRICVFGCVGLGGDWLNVAVKVTLKEIIGFKNRWRDESEVLRMWSLLQHGLTAVFFFSNVFCSHQGFHIVTFCTEVFSCYVSSFPVHSVEEVHLKLKNSVPHVAFNGYFASCINSLHCLYRVQ